ncbi:zinc finger protein-like 1 homolog isoform X1 [Selaginella moellendorffii]|uniref:zinc finger protein-like 1 homolog isoform X1 n=1 Tax=Selaginella moellendorffii TaxID=88036 RepID=UPI000D1D0DEB|nr:zinc finger protein-like 1 homolog isoform X1 [Selaginella moellendorffii]|eukprot:XP_024540792.1 zinc finger protein-like 1 homolog isoform X1 [Selaginella moellendorffii]
MVVCKCRASTRLYCFVHKVPVCSQCICFQQHQLCVVRTYAEWVVDGDYDWPPQCSLCQQSLLGAEGDVIRLGCLHLLHGACLKTLLTSGDLHGSSPHACPSCSSVVWPPKNFRDLGTGLPLVLKQAISQTSGDGTESFPKETRDLSPETSSSETVLLSEAPKLSSSVVDMRTSQEFEHPPSSVRDENEWKYRRRGPMHRQVARHLLPLWASSRAATTLPLTTAEDCRRASKASTSKILLFVAIMSCIATVVLLYQRIQR